MTRALALLLCLSCASVGKATFSAYGSAHLGADANAMDVSLREHRVLVHCVRDLGWPMDRVREAIAAAEVHWVPLPWRGPDGHEWAGMTEGHVITVARTRPDAFEHEMLHLIGAYLGWPDPEHLHIERWEVQR